jgi:hypothetical protein
MKHEGSEIHEQEHECFEAELRRLRPVRLTDDTLDRFAAVRQCQAGTTHRRTQADWPFLDSVRWCSLRRWLAPALGAVVVAIAMAGWWGWRHSSDPAGNAQGQAASPSPMLNADTVEIDRQLVASFDAIASLPDGEPVRVRFSEWEDQVCFRDTARGVTVEKRTPRLEVVPVRFETY